MSQIQFLGADWTARSTAGRIAVSGIGSVLAGTSSAAVALDAPPNRARTTGESWAGFVLEVSVERVRQARRRSESGITLQ